MTDAFDSVLTHYGTPRHSGRYPWGSGENPHQRNMNFLQYLNEMRKEGLTDTEIARGIGEYTGEKFSTTQLRALNSIAKNGVKAANIAQAVRLKERDLSTVAIGQKMGLPEATVRDLLKDSTKIKNDRLIANAETLKREVAEKTYVDFSSGTSNHLGISDTQLGYAIAMLKEQGYTVHYIKIKQLGTSNFTSSKVLAAPGVTYKDVVQNQHLIKSVAPMSDKGEAHSPLIQPPLIVDPKRVMVRYGDEGGREQDGVIEIRRNVEDLNMVGKRYAQVRVKVGNDHYLKGMAIYADDLPDGIDIRFNTNKDDKGDKLKAMKPIADDPENPFGSIVRQHTDPNGKLISALNIVNDEGDWDQWSSKISSQALSKQPTSLAKEQLSLTYARKLEELNEIKQLNNPAIKTALLNAFADDADSSAVHLKAAGLPRTRSKVILPINSLKDNEIYAPTFRNGERVVLIRHPHGGIFEIPELVVNNKNKDALRLFPNAYDAVGINSKVAARLSGADFDGDTVLVIPNNLGKVQHKSPLEGLVDFDPQAAYPMYEGMTPMSTRTKQIKMGDISNLITDMTIKGAPDAELARAVRHSMVVIDAEKHKLNYVQSAKDNGISALKKKYQGRANSGATTLISRAKAPIRVDNRRAARVSEGGPINPETGVKNWVPTGEQYTVPAHEKVMPSGKVVQVPERIVVKTFESKQLAETDDAYTLVSGVNGEPIERVYADYSNKMKALANDARKTSLAVKPLKYSPSAKQKYAPQVERLNAALDLAKRNAPLERQAQLIASLTVKAKMQEGPELEKDEIKKLNGMELTKARLRVGAKKNRIEINPLEWEAIQAGAISHSKLESILANANLDQVKELATPRDSPALSVSMLARARAMLANGYTQADVADALGVSTSTLSSSLKGKG